MLSLLIAAIYFNVRKKVLEILVSQLSFNEYYINDEAKKYFRGSTLNSKSIPFELVTRLCKNLLAILKNATK